MSKVFTCDICGKQEIGYPNNPFPYLNEGSCCMECNFGKVIPLRAMGITVPMHQLNSTYIKLQRERYTKERESEEESA